MKKLILLLLFVLTPCPGCGGSQTPAEEVPSPGVSSPVAAAPSAPAQPPVPTRSFRKLEVSSVTQSGGTVIIKGTTDLPDSALVTVTFDVAGRAPTDTYIGVDERVPVESGRFEAKLDIPDRPEFRKGPYVVELLFTPKGQSPEVQSLVGPNGEHLERGEKTYDFKVWNVTREVKNLKVATSAHSLPDPEAFPKGSPQQLMAKVLLAWSRKDWGAMADLTQDSWRARQREPEEFLKSSFEIFVPFGANDLRVDDPTSEAVRVSVVVHGAIGPSVQKKRLEVMVIRENGRWGFNPISMLRMTDL